MALDETDSTNAEALRLARKGELGPIWVRAHAQTAGRGRQGKTWVSEPGNLYCSALLIAGEDPKTWAQLGFVAGLAAYDAVRHVLGNLGADHSLHLKWPNDLLLDNAKVSGILLESTMVPEVGAVIVVGIGINVAHSPASSGVAYETTHLCALNRETDADRVFEHLAERFAHWHAKWAEGAGFAGIRETWMARARGLGEKVTVNMPGEKLTGIFSRLDDDGALVLELDDGSSHWVLVGDLFFGPQEVSESARQETESSS